MRRCPGTMADEFYLRYYTGHQGKFGHEFLEFEFRCAWAGGAHLHARRRRRVRRCARCALPAIVALPHRMGQPRCAGRMGSCDMPTTQTTKATT